MNALSTVTLGLLMLSSSGGCAYTSFKNLNARAMTTPIEPAPARVGARFCFERAAEYSRRERSHRLLSDGAFGVSVIGLGTAAATGFALGAAEDPDTERTLKILSLSSLVLGGAAALTWGYFGYRADNAEADAQRSAARGLRILGLAERLAAAKRLAREKVEKAERSARAGAGAGVGVGGGLWVGLWVGAGAAVVAEAWDAKELASVPALEKKLAGAFDDCVEATGLVEPDPSEEESSKEGK